MANEDLGTKWVIREVDGKLQTFLTINGHPDCPAEIDTGADEVVRTDPDNKALFGWQPGVREYETKFLGFRGVMHGLYFQPELLDINGAKIVRPKVDLNVDPNWLARGTAIGGGFLSHFLVTIDVAGGAMYLKPVDPPTTMPTSAPSR